MRSSMRGLLAFCTAILLAGTSASAQNALSADEIFRRLEIQARNLPRAQTEAAGATRGMRFDYGQAPEIMDSSPYDANASATVYEAEPVTLPGGSYEATTLPADPVELFYPQPQSVPAAQPAYAGTAQPTRSATRKLSLESYTQYTPVLEEGRIDLRIYFEWNSAALRPEAIGQLSELCTAIRRVAGSRVFKIIGHTDKSGSDAYNLYLSEARAREVKRHLVEECAIPERALLAIGEGERQSDPNTPALAPDERLVEFQLVG